MKTTLLAIFYLVLTVSAFAQDETLSEQKTPLQTSYIFDQYRPNEISGEKEKEKIELFVMQIKNISEFAGGVIYVYRGISDYKFDAEKRSDSISEILHPLLESNSIEPYKIFTRFVGFREESTIEMMIKPSSSEMLTATPTISLEDLKFYADDSLPKGTIQKTWKQLSYEIIKKIDPPYPAAAKAVRAIGEVGVLIKIDEKGNITEARAFLGHPLLRAACVTALRQSQFKPQLQKKTPVKTVGIGVCEFNPE
jgi:Gram-negative bacterial TonB protein C-terminal